HRAARRGSRSSRCSCEVCSSFGEESADVASNGADRCHRRGIVHRGWRGHGESCERVDLATVTAGDNRSGLQLLIWILVTDPDGYFFGTACLAEQLEQNHLLLQGLQHRPDRGLELSTGTCQVGHTADHHPA